MSFKDEFLKRRRGEWRKKYKVSKTVDTTCRNHGACGWCRGNRNHSNKKRESRARELEKEICDALAEVKSAMNDEIELKTLLEFIDELEKEIEC